MLSAEKNPSGSCKQYSLKIFNNKNAVLGIGIGFNADPDPALYVNADPDPVIWRPMIFATESLLPEVSEGK